MQREPRWSVLVHGGARRIPPEQREACEQGCLQAVSLAAEILAGGGTALDAVEAAVRVLEDLPHFNAGASSVRNIDGQVEMDAAIMDGRTLSLGGVGALKNVRHPVSVARDMLEDVPTLVVGSGAAAFARRVGAEHFEDGALAPDPDNDGYDTVGCVARDRNGNVAAAGSTGGLEGKMVGRVGDTPLPGCGLYADDEMGAAALSGQGEAISRNILAARALHALASVGVSEAAEAAIGQLKRTGGEAGIILIDPSGNIGIAHNSQNFAVAAAASWLENPRAGVSAADLREVLS